MLTKACPRYCYRVSQCFLGLPPKPLSTGSQQPVWCTVRFGSTAKVITECNLKYYRISECGVATPWTSRTSSGRPSRLSLLCRLSSTQHSARAQCLILISVCPGGPHPSPVCMTHMSDYRAKVAQIRLTSVPELHTRTAQTDASDGRCCRVGLQAGQRHTKGKQVGQQDIRRGP